MNRPLQKEPALAVYRNAAKSVEDDYLLAAILVATIECITTDGSCAYLSNFELSIQNVLERLKINEVSIFYRINVFSLGPLLEIYF